MHTDLLRSKPALRDFVFQLLVTDAGGEILVDSFLPAWRAVRARGGSRWRSPSDQLAQRTYPSADQNGLVERSE